MTREEQLEKALKPFADFLDAFIEWRYDDHVIQTRRPNHIPVLRWEQPSAPYPSITDTIQFRELWLSDFENAHKLLEKKK